MSDEKHKTGYVVQLNSVQDKALRDVAATLGVEIDKAPEALLLDMLDSLAAQAVLTTQLMGALPTPEPDHGDV